MDNQAGQLVIFSVIYQVYTRYIPHLPDVYCRPGKHAFWAMLSSVYTTLPDVYCLPGKHAFWTMLSSVHATACSVCVKTMCIPCWSDFIQVCPTFCVALDMTSRK